MNKLILSLLLLGTGIRANGQPTDQKVVYETQDLRIEKLSAHVYVHISYLTTSEYGKVPCNGLLVIDAGEAIVFDTPTTNQVSDELINWVEKDQKSKIKAVVVNHFHDDCLGGLAAFHQHDVPSYAEKLTIQIAETNGVEVPKIGFDGTMEITAGQKHIINRFFGEAHSSDNIVSYVKGENILFGGCMIKAEGAGQGNLRVANLDEWASTVQKIKEAFPDLQVVVPGHGQPGNQALLDYTIQMFRK